MKHLLYILAIMAGLGGLPLVNAETGGNTPAEQDPHAGHDMHGGGSDPHAGHDMHGSPGVTTGPWSYLDRENPQPHTKNRWEMIPVPGYGHMFLHADKVSEELRCAALQNPGVMVDRVERARCAGTSAPAAQPYTVPEKDSAPAHVH